MEDIRKIPYVPGSFISYMRDYLDRRGKIVTSKEEIKYLLLLFQNLYKNEKIALEGHQADDRFDGGCIMIEVIKRHLAERNMLKTARSVSLLPGKKGRRKMCTGSRSHHSK